MKVSRKSTLFKIVLAILGLLCYIIFMNYETIDSREKKGGERRHKFVQALVCPHIHKALRRLALEQDITLAELLQEVIEFYLTEKGGCKLWQRKRN